MDNFCQCCGIYDCKKKSPTSKSEKATHKLIVRNYRDMRYCTVGDQLKRNGSWELIVADMGDRLYNFLICLHELIELELCEKAGVKQKDIDRFDIWFEEEAAKGNKKLKKYDEPGVCPQAPYHKQHMFTMKVERMIAKALGVNWKDYNRIVDRIYEKVKKEKIGK